MNELSLFSGAGGGLLGTKLLGWRTLGYVEFNDYCQRVIKARIEDGILDEAPIFGDIRAFISEGYAESYRGHVDVVTGGFPCQPFSVAGKRAAADDPRNTWPETIECVRIIRPRYAFLENVPGLLSRSHGYFEEILKDLAESGYDAKWKVISAAEMGAPHKRDRLWIQCSDTLHSTGSPEPEREHERAEEPSGGSSDRLVAGEDVADAAKRDDGGGYTEPSEGQIQQSGKCDSASNVADTNEERLQGGGEDRRTSGPAGLCGGTRRDKISDLPESHWWAVEPDVGRVAHGVASRVDRLKALGNGQVPAVVEAAWGVRE